MSLHQYQFACVGCGGCNNETTNNPWKKGAHSTVIEAGQHGTTSVSDDVFHGLSDWTSEHGPHGKIIMFRDGASIGAMTALVLVPPDKN